MGQVLYAKSKIDDAGNIQVHGRGGLRIVYQRTSGGVAQDISADVLHFEIAGVVRVALQPHADPTKRVILIEDTVIEGLPLRQPVAFVLRDETLDPVVARWDGFIVARGFTAQPA